MDAERRIEARITERVPPGLRRDLEHLLEETADAGVTRFVWLRQFEPGSNSADANRLLDRLEHVRRLDVPEGLFHEIPPHRITRLRRQGERYFADGLRELPDNRRLAILAVCAVEWEMFLADAVVETHDRVVGRTYREATRACEAQLGDETAAVRESLRAFAELGRALLGARDTGEALDAVIADGPGWEGLGDLVSKATALASTAVSDPLNHVLGGYSRFRRYTPRMLRTLDIEASPAAEPLLEAVGVLRSDGTARPTGFLRPNSKWSRLLRTQSDHRLWETAVLFHLRDAFRAGDVWLARSRRYGDIRKALLSAPAVADADRSLPAPASPHDWLAERRLALDEGLRRLAAAARAGAIRLADLLIEVENDLGFSVHFQQPGEKRVDPGEVCALLAAILAHGCNLGLYTMEKVAPDIAYRRLKYVSDWRLVEENQRAALAAIVHGISRLDAAGHWGDGTTSASDGQRFAMPQKVLQRTYSTRFNDFALEFYSFVADNYAPFYSRPIECTDRDAPFVLDGVLYHESDLDLEEHYTDTHGYTEINFAAFGMVGVRFCPRIRSLHRQRIYCADPDRDHGVLEPVLKRGRRAVNFRVIAEQWDRIGQFYAAFPAGHATASAALQRLNRFQASNRFYAANRELGRALKTEFVLQYMSEPQLRAKVRRGLLKVEQLHALARAVYYGQRGRISAREVYDQMNACSCLTLILACIVYWQAREISRMVAAPDFPFDPDLLRHISPIEWKNVVLYGEIKIDPAKLTRRSP